MAIATYQPSYARPQVKALARSTARPAKPATTAARNSQSISEARAYDLIFDRGATLGLIQPTVEPIRQCGRALFFDWQDKARMPQQLPGILQILASRIEARQQEIKEYRRKLNARLDWEENHLI